MPQLRLFPDSARPLSPGRALRPLRGSPGGFARSVGRGTRGPRPIARGRSRCQPPPAAAAGRLRPVTPFLLAPALSRATSQSEATSHSGVASPSLTGRAAVVTPSLRNAICHSLSHGAEESLAHAGLQGTRAPLLRGPVLPSPLLVLEGALASAPPQPGLQPSGAQRQDVGTPARPAGASLAAALGPGSAAAR